MTAGTNSDIKEKLKLSRNVFGLLHKINYYFLFGSDSGLHFASYRINPTNMVKHTQTIKLQITDKLFKCVWPFCGVGV